LGALTGIRVVFDVTRSIRGNRGNT
jgi:hypothetical protein